MADFLSIDLNRFEDQMLNFIEIYYNIIKKEGDEPLISIKKEGGIKWKNQIIKLLENYYQEVSQKWIKSRMEAIKDYMEEATKKKKLNIEFYMIMDISEVLFEIYFDKKKPKNQKKSSEHIKKRIAKCIYRELIELRNELSHNENPPYEYILRFYEDQYYLIKFMKPENVKVQLSDYIIKEIKMNIHLYLEKNLKNNKSFELNPIQEEFLKFEELNEINEENLNNKYLNKNLTITNETKNEIESMFKFEPFKLPKFNFINQSNEEQKSLVQNSVISISNSSIMKDEYFEINNDSDVSGDLFSDFSDSSASSERNSVIENTQVGGNIKEKTNESKRNISEIDRQENI